MKKIVNPSDDSPAPFHTMTFSFPCNIENIPLSISKNILYSLTDHRQKHGELNSEI